MDTSNSFNFRIIDLERSNIPGNQETAEKANELLKALIEDLKPLLRYITRPIEVWTADKKMKATCHATEVPIKRNAFPDDVAKKQLFIQSDGSFFTITNFKITGSVESSYWQPKEDPSKEEIFSDLLEGLQALLEKAKKKHEEHVKVVDLRLSKLNEMMKIIKG